MGFYSAQRFYADFSAVMTGFAVNEYHPRNLYYHLSFATGNKKCPLDMDRRIKNSDPRAKKRSRSAARKSEGGGLSARDDTARELQCNGSCRHRYKSEGIKDSDLRHQTLMACAGECVLPPKRCISALGLREGGTLVDTQNVHSFGNFSPCKAGFV